MLSPRSLAAPQLLQLTMEDKNAERKISTEAQPTTNTANKKSGGGRPVTVERCTINASKIPHQIRTWIANRMVLPFMNRDAIKPKAFSLVTAQLDERKTESRSSIYREETSRNTFQRQVKHKTTLNAHSRTATYTCPAISTGNGLPFGDSN